MTAHVRDAGVWKELDEMHVKDAGVWKEIKEAYVRDGGVWKKFFQAFKVALSGTQVSPTVSSDTDTSSALAGWSFAADGVLGRYEVGTLNAAWGSSQDPAEWASGTPPITYYVRATLDTGTAPSGAALNTWHALTTTRVWTWSQSGDGANSGTIKVDIASDSGGLDIVATGYYRGVATVTSA